MDSRASEGQILVHNSLRDTQPAFIFPSAQILLVDFNPYPPPLVRRLQFPWVNPIELQASDSQGPWNHYNSTSLFLREHWLVSNMGVLLSQVKINMQQLNFQLISYKLLTSTTICLTPIALKLLLMISPIITFIWLDPVVTFGNSFHQTAEQHLTQLSTPSFLKPAFLAF